LSELCGFGLLGLLALARPSAAHSGAPRLLRRFVRIAAPDALGALIGSSLRTAQGLLIVPCLRRSGADSDSAIASYGVLQGMVLPVLLYPSALLLSLAGLLVPEIAAAHARGQKARISALATRVLRLSAMFAVGVAGLAFGLADEIARAIYGDRSLAAMLRLFAPLLPLMYLDFVVDGMLKGLDQQLRSMSYNMLEASLGLALVCLLIPRYGMMGYVATVFVSRTLNALLSLQRLARVGELSLDLWAGLFKPCGAAAL
ncbi:MAG: polysaccharide biosynthesis C-terminal domain-containing protein, partial [Oscillospiraceae bacterium]